jgi:hypothetical protein
MSRRFRLTCARTTYFEIEVDAEDSAGAERLLETSIGRDVALRDQAQLLGRPIHRIVEVAAVEGDAAAEVATAA